MVYRARLYLFDPAVWCTQQILWYPRYLARNSIRYGDLGHTSADGSPLTIACTRYDRAQPEQAVHPTDRSDVGTGLRRIAVRPIIFFPALNDLGAHRAAAHVCLSLIHI